MSLPVLYSFRRCPYAMRARLALKYAGVNVELREIVLRDKPAAMLAISPKGTVPVLQLPDGTVIDESLDIMRWALLQSDPAGWLAHADMATADALIAINDGPFKQLLDRYKYAEREVNRSTGKHAEDWRDEALALHLAPLDARLRQTPYLLGAHPSLTDMAIMPFVRQFAQVDSAWFDGNGTDAPLPALRIWLEGLTASDLFAAVMHKLPVWKPGDPVTVF